MVDIRPNVLPDAILPLRDDDAIIVDQGVDGVRKTNPAGLTDSVSPVASQPEAIAGTDNTKRMTPLRTKQSIASEVGVTVASISQGAKADSAVQPARSITAGTGLSGGGNLSADRSISLNPASIASLAKADSSVQTVNGIAPTGGNVNVSANFINYQDTRASAILVNFSSAVHFVKTAGRDSVGDGGETLYKRDTSLKSGGFQSADGTFWSIADQVIKPESYGSDGAAFNAALQVARDIGSTSNTGPAPIFLMGGAYAPAGGFSVEDSLIYKNPGSSLYSNTSAGWQQHVNTLPSTFDAYTLDPVNVTRYFDAQVKDTTDPTKTNGLLKAGSPITSQTVFGSTSPAIGTPLAIRATMIVHDVAIPDIGYNEIGGIYNHIVVMGNKTQPTSKYSIWAHDTIAMTGKNRPKWFGSSFRFHNMSNANPNGGTGFGEGLTGISVMQRPLFAEDATYAGYLPTDAVYPMAAGITISGFGGPQSATDGTSATALHAFYVGLQIGGANSPYLPESSRSKIDQGIVISDYTKNGIVVGSPHPSFNPSPTTGASIVVANNAGPVILGVTSPSQTATIHVKHATDGNIKLYKAPSQTTNVTSLINYDNLALLGMDLSSTNSNTFGLYHVAAGKYGFTVNPDGHFALSNPPTSAAGLAAGTLWKDNAAGGVIKAA